MMQGKIDGDTFVVMDAFALPVVGTETRVNAAKCVVSGRSIDPDLAQRSQ